MNEPIPSCPTNDDNLWDTETLDVQGEDGRRTYKVVRFKVLTAASSLDDRPDDRAVRTSETSVYLHETTPPDDVSRLTSV
jgi:hypothetical protein